MVILRQGLLFRILDLLVAILDKWKMPATFRLKDVQFKSDQI